MDGGITPYRLPWIENTLNPDFRLKLWWVAAFSGVATHFFVQIIDRERNKCYYMMLVNANQEGRRYAKYSGKNDQWNV